MGKNKYHVQDRDIKVAQYKRALKTAATIMLTKYVFLLIIEIKLQLIFQSQAIYIGSVLH